MNFPLRVFAVDREIFVGDAKSLIVPTARIFVFNCLEEAIIYMS